MKQTEIEKKAEEIIKEKYCNNCEERETFPDIYNCSDKEHCDDYYLLKEGILLGLAEGRKEKWHDLRKDPNDLPKHSGLYCVQCGEVREYVKEEQSWFTVHFEPCMNCTEETYLWCELPKFEE